MKFKILLLFFLFKQIAFSQLHSVYLIGDAGEYTYSGKALLLLKEKIEKDENSTVLFLGDNVYPDGLDIKDRSDVLKLKSQLSILKNYKGNVYFVTGNHDWSAEKRDGYKKLAQQEKMVNSYIHDSTLARNRNSNSFLPKNGLPGPESIMLSEKLRILFVDTQWFLHYYKKNKTISVKQTKKIFYKKLDSILTVAEQNGEKVIIAAHHPIYTNGFHSSKREPLRFLVNYTPLKIFGWIGLDRLLSQDIDSPRYKKMRKQLITIFNKHSNIIYVSGHDHNMQYFKMNNNKYIVSGCGSKLKKLRKKKRFNPVYETDDKTGFIKITFGSGINESIEVFKSDESILKIE